VTVQLAPDRPLSPKLVSDIRAWKEDYPWLHQSLKQVGPRAEAASEGWRRRIQDELKTTLDFKIRPDGTAAVWCGMSGYDFHHDPTPKELFEGLAEAYRRERKRVGGSNPWKLSAEARVARPEAPRLQPAMRALSTPARYSLTQVMRLVLLPRAEQLVLIFLAVTILTLALASVAIAFR
jgi:hypothetical protein